MLSQGLRCIITGCPCSGTAYIAQALFERGIKAGHEVFAIDPQGQFETSCEDGHSALGTALEEVEIDVSYAYADTLGHLLPSSPVKVIHLVRDPLKTLNSWLSMCLRHPEPTSPGEVAKKLWGYNDNVNKSFRLNYRHRVEDPIEMLVHAMGLKEEKGREVVKNLNEHNKGRCNFSWEDLKNHPWCEKLREQYRDYGYV